MINKVIVYYFKASDVGKVLNLSNIRVSIQNFDDGKVDDLRCVAQDTSLLTSRGV